MNRDKKKAAAACELEGDLYSMQRDLKLAKVMSNSLVDGFFEEEDLDCASNNLPMLMLKYVEAWTQINVLHDYIAQATQKVNDLLKRADEYEGETVPNIAASSVSGDAATITVKAIDLLTSLPQEKRGAALAALRAVASADADATKQKGLS